MKKGLLVVLISFLLIPAVKAAPGDTTIVVAHQEVDMTWYGPYDQWTVFPSTGTYAKVVMEYTMGCASTGCSDWDYTTSIHARIKTGILDSTVASIDTVGGVIDTTWQVFEVLDQYELGRAITPYGGYMANGSNGYNNNWEHRFYYDVTDYQSLLRDSVQMRAFYSGWSSGFSAGVKFYFIEGTPPRDVLSISNIINRSFNYQNLATVDSLYLTPTMHSILPNAQGSAMRVITSGHGFDNNVYCAEFCVRNYLIDVDGQQQVSQSMWRDDCGLNPIYPQGGTWLYDRANWCPGSKATGYWHDLTSSLTPGQTHEIDMSLSGYNWSGTQAPSYIMSAVLFQYGGHNRTLDAAIETILAPSLQEEYARLNPVCGNATIELKNYGSTPLTSVTLSYSGGGGPLSTTWTGNLAFGESEIVNLPLGWHSNLFPATFEVEITDVNGQGLDDLAWNNSQETPFDVIDTWPKDVLLELRTNTMGWQTDWTLEDAFGTVLYSGDNLSNNTLYRDTFNLTVGCYHLRVNDAGKNGLSWWADNEGTGYCRVREVGGSIVKIFKADFGTRIDFEFQVTSAFSNTEEDQFVLDVYPNPTRGLFSVDYALNRADEALLQILSMQGQVVRKAHFEAALNQRWEVDLSNEPKGVYLLQIQTTEYSSYRKVVVQ